jgi:UDP-N-acetylmuramate dehydrogenase
MKIKKQIDINRFLPGVQKNIPLAKYTTFKIGGRAKYFFTAKTKEDLIKAVAMAKKLKLPFFILGRGSNLLVSDEGYEGLIIKFEIPNSKIQIKSKTEFPFMETKVKKRIKPSSPIQNPKIYVEAGAMLGELANATANAGLSGLEWAAGIPGTVGGAIYGNAGAFQKSMKDIIEKVEVFDTEELRIKNYELSDCRFGYRESIFKRNKNLIILSAKIKLKKGKKKEIQKKIKEYLNYKKEKQPLNYPSAGSVFKNFTQSRNKICGAGPKELKRFKKMGAIPAAWLIDKCGLKGKKIGEAQISKIHANFIVNLGGGKAKNVIRLINLAKKKVKKKFKINLEEEIQHLGFKD